MALKKALYYSIRINLHDDIVAITTEKTNGRWFGRYVKDNTVTHGAPCYGRSDIRGRFASIEAAEEKRAELATISQLYALRREPHEKEIRSLYEKERLHLLEALEPE